MEINYYSMTKEERDRVRQAICDRAYQEIPPAKDGQGELVVNVGWGIPLNIIKTLEREGRNDVLLQGESCCIGMGRHLEPEGDYDMHHVDPAGIPFQPMENGACTLTLADAFAFINSKRIYATFLGAFQVAANGDMANWDSGGEVLAGPGGAMALVRGARHVVVCMVENDKNGDSKLVNRCNLPLTGEGCVDLVITDKGVYKPDGKHFKVLEKYDPEQGKYVG
jgi:3-oxoacid CoA-transferase subunit B